MFSAINTCAQLDSDDLANCASNLLIDDVILLEKREAELRVYRDAMSARARNYSCADTTLNSSVSLQQNVVHIEDKQYIADSLLNMTRAKIWVVSQFIADDECELLMQSASSRLHRAVLSDEEDGSALVSEVRKAQQAAYSVARRGALDPLW